MLDRVIHELPHSIEAEQAVLGAILMRNGVLDQLPRLTPEQFFDPMHGELFAVMLAQWRDLKAVNVATLQGVISKFPKIEKIDCVEYVRRLAANGDTGNVGALADLIADYAQRRALCDLARNIDQSARWPSCAVTDVSATAVEALGDVLRSAKGKRKTSFTLLEAFSDCLDSALNDDGSERITTGLATVDAAVGSWRRKQFAILAGRPGMGKTTVAMSAMLRTAKAGHGVLAFSLEMPANALAARCLSDLSWSSTSKVQYSRILDGRLSDRDADALARAAGDFGALPLIIDDERGLTIAEIASRARTQAEKFTKDGKRLGLIVVDHLGLIRPSGRYTGNKVHEVAEVSDALATLAKDLDVAVLALHQLNRGTEGREDKRPTLADLRDSGNIEQDADIVCFAYRASYYLERTKFDPGSQKELARETELEACANTLDLMVAKNRNGPTKTISLFCDMGCNVIRDLAA